MKRGWSIEGTERRADGDEGIILSSGVNEYGDGPADYPCRVYASISHATSEQSRAVAERIILAVNCHDELTSALEEAIALIPEGVKPSEVSMMHCILRKARGAQ